MEADSHLCRLRCPACDWQTICDSVDVLGRVQVAGMLKRETDPEWGYLFELFSSVAKRLSCESCSHQGLVCEEVDADDEGDWPEARKCEVCKQVIPAERLEVFPKALRCAVCQESNAPGADDEVEYCGRCGAVMTMRQSASGITRYKMVCSECGRS